MSTITVNSTATLTSALNTAKGGDTILLAPGTYSDLGFKVAPKFDVPVTITSLDPSKPAVLTDFTLNGAKGLTFSNIEMAATNHPELAAAGSYWAFKIINGDDIHFDKVSIHGSLDGDAKNDVQGLQFRSSTNVSVSNSEFQQLERGMVVSQTKGITASDNYVHDLRSDGFDFAEVGNVKLVGNVFRNFTPINGDHPDAIQFWTTGTKTASHDILIADNVVLRGEGDWTQGIFLGEEVGTLAYERVTISNNLIVGTGYNGIRVNHTHGLTLTENELVSFDGASKTFLLVQGSDNVVATGNSAATISFTASTRVTEIGNTISAAVFDKGAEAIQNWVAETGGASAVSGVLHTAVKFAETAANADALAAKLARVAVVDDMLVGTRGADHLQGFAGNDTLDGQGGVDTLSGGVGDDVYIVPNSLAVIVEKAGEGIDTVIARGEHFLADNVENLIISTADDRGWRGYGNSLDNRLTGNAGGNQLDGGAGADTLDGGAGADTLIGGVGSDFLTGGSGADVFRFLPGSGKDVVSDFGAGTDRDTLDIAAFIKAGLAPTVTDVGPDVMISFTNGDSITLLGLHASAIGTVSKTGWVF